MIAKYAFRIAVALLTVGILILGSFLVVVAIPDIAGQTAVVESPSPTAAPSGRSAMGLSPVGIEIPADTDCDACHVTTTGEVGTKPIPVMAHPLLGWRNCTACHSVGSLVTTAPGHSSLHKDECLICHQTQVAAGTETDAPIRPEHMGEGGKACTDCHGVDQHAPMPDTMKGREGNCWICHNGSEFTYLFEESSPAVGDGDADVDDEGGAPTPSPDASPAASAATGAVSTPLYRLKAPALP